MKAHIQPTLASRLFLIWRWVMEIERPEARVMGADPALVERAEPGQCLFQSVDGAGGGLEIAVRYSAVASSGRLRPVVAIARVCAANTADRRRTYELVAVVAVQIPWARSAVDDDVAAQRVRGRPREGPGPPVGCHM